MTPDILVSILTFVVAALSIALSMTGLVPPQLVPWVQFAIAIVNAALGIFFGTQKPIATVRAARAAAAAKKPN